MQTSRNVVRAALGPVLGAGAKGVDAIVSAIRRRVGAEPDSDPRAVAHELRLHTLPIMRRLGLPRGVRAEVRGDCVRYRWTRNDWRDNLWIGIGYALDRARPGLRSCRPA